MSQWVRHGALSLALAAVFGCSRGEHPLPAAAASARPPLILISIDTLRSDHLPAYGYRGVATPAIDALRRDAVLFERAYAEVPLTVPSHVALLTGVPPWQNGVRDNTAIHFDAQTLPYLPAELARSGYRTGGAVSVYPLARRTGFAGGFEFYEDRLLGPRRDVPAGTIRPGLATLAAARDWLSAVAAQPFFFFLHVYEPHSPHDPPPPFPPTYDGDVAAADQAVGALVDELRRLGVYDRAAILLVSDHGEGLGDHGEEEHGLLLYRESLQVPMLLKLPRGERAGTSVASPVELLDVAPTLLALAGTPPPARMVGHSLLADPGARTLLGETLYPRLHFGWSELLSAIDGDLHYIDGPRPELYDLRSDPAESHDLLADRRRDAARLKTAVAVIDRRVAPAPVDDEARRALASLGYLSGGGATRAGEAPANPRDRVRTLDHLRQGVEAWARGDYGRAAGALEIAVRENPGVLDGWDFLGRSYQRLGRFDRCVAAFSELLRLSDQAPDAACAAAQCLLQMGRGQEALALLRGEGRRSPSAAQIRLLAAQIELRSGDAAGARATVAELLVERPDFPDALYLRGAIAMGSGDPVGAERDLRRVLELDPEHAAAMSDLAVLLSSLGRNEEARELLRRVLSLHPDDPMARRNLEALGPG